MLIPQPNLSWPDPFKINSLSVHQMETLKSSLASRVGILAGTPGTGKSYTTAAIIKEILGRPGLFRSVAVAAPTGKAAIRITELLRTHGITLEATTIHSLLEIGRNGHDGKGWGFRRNRANQLEQSFFFIDEFSMCDVNTCAALFSALPDEAHVLLIGDPHQLPPVGHGAPLRDMIDSGSVSYGELTEVRRNAGDIVHGCRKVKDGIFFEPNCDRLDLESGRNWLHSEISSPFRQIDRLQMLLDGLPSRFDKLSDVQVICALNEKGPLSRVEVNKILQRQLNPDHPIEKGRRFALGDKVVCMSSAPFEVCQFIPHPSGNASLATIEAIEIEEYVRNGETGRVVFMDDKNAVIHLHYPSRHILMSLRNSKSDGDDSGSGSGSSGGNSGGSSSFDLAYALTCHKMQGSQSPIVIGMVDESPGAGWVTSREWWYTGISRAEQICLTIGKWKSLMSQCRIQSLKKRQTFLQQRIKNAVEELIPL